MPISLVLTLFVLGGFVHPVHAFLDVGDPAPPLKIAEWVKGKPVDLGKDHAKRVHLIEFWAVWCPPCKESIPRLTSIQNRHKNKLAIVSVTAPDLRGNTPTAIRRFVEEQGTAMDYRVAIDDREQTTNSYMVAARAIGIPHAFLVGKDGNIAWQGSPLDPGLEDVIAGLIEGTYDPRIEAEVNRRFLQLDWALRRGEWEAVTKGLKEILALSPANEVALRALKRVYVDEQGKPDAFRQWAREHVARHKSNQRSLELLAMILIEDLAVFQLDPELALEVARAAYEASSTPSPSAIQIYAQAHYLIGALDRAIALQEQAVTLSNGTERKFAQSVYDFYKRCKALHAKLPQ